MRREVVVEVCGEEEGGGGGGGVVGRKRPRRTGPGQTRGSDLKVKMCVIAGCLGAARGVTRGYLSR